MSPITDKTFTNADGHTCIILGKCRVTVNYEFDLELIVMKTDGKKCFLMGRTWLDIIFPSWRSYFTENLSSNEINDFSLHSVEMEYVNKIKRDFKKVFEARDTPIRNVLVHLELKEDFVPKFRKAAPVPFALKKDVESRVSIKGIRV